MLRFFEENLAMVVSLRFGVRRNAKKCYAFLASPRLRLEIIFSVTLCQENENEYFKFYFLILIHSKRLLEYRSNGVL